MDIDENIRSFDKFKTEIEESLTAGPIKMEDNCKRCKWFEGLSVGAKKVHNGDYFYDTGHCFKLEGHFPFDLQKFLPKICKFWEMGTEWIPSLGDD